MAPRNSKRKRADDDQVASTTAASTRSADPNRTTKRKKKDGAGKSSNTQSKPTASAIDSNDHGALEPTFRRPFSPPPAGYRKTTNPYLTQKTRYIPQSTVTSKWTPLTVPAQEAVRSVIAIAARTVVQSQPHNRQKEADDVLRGVMKKLERQVPRIPFPKGRAGNKGEAFVGEVLERRRADLEAQLASVEHAMVLVEEEIEREEETMAEEREALERLERNEKAELRAWKAEERRIPLDLQTFLEPTRARDSTVDDQPIPPAKIVPAPDYEALDTYIAKDDSDPDLTPILEQLRNHLDSLHANSEQVQGISQTVDTAQASLEEVMLRKKGEEVFLRWFGSVGT